jgi:predicted ABC-type ATPase
MKMKPRLVVIAGPNGAGKTTITEQLLKHTWLEDTVYVNPDIIAQEKFGGWNNKESFIEAANYAQKIREDCLQNRQSLVFETVFSTQEKINFIQRAIRAGFFVRLFFIATENPVINIKRILLRISKGGHQVPTEKIIERHYKSIKNCSLVVNLADRVYVYDNSVEDKKPTLIFRIANKDKKTIKKEYGRHLDWTQVIFGHIQ